MQCFQRHVDGAWVRASAWRVTNWVLQHRAERRPPHEHGYERTAPLRGLRRRDRRGPLRRRAQDHGALAATAVLAALPSRQGRDGGARLHHPAGPRRDLRAADRQGRRRAGPERAADRTRSTTSACRPGPSVRTTLFGVDQIGRDVFARTIYGARISLTVALIATALIVRHRHRRSAWSPASTAAGPTPCSRAIMDVQLAFPVLLLALGLGAACSLGGGCLGGLIQPGLPVVIFVIVARPVALLRPHHPRAGRCPCARRSSSRRPARSGASNTPHHLPRDPPQPAGPDHRLHDADHPDQHPVRGGAVLPRRRGSAPDADLGGDDRRGHQHLRHRLVVHARPRASRWCSPCSRSTSSATACRTRSTPRATGSDRSLSLHMSQQSTERTMHMRRVRLSALLIGLIAVLALVAAGCGGADSEQRLERRRQTSRRRHGRRGQAGRRRSPSSPPPTSTTSTRARRYYTFGYLVHYAVNRTLYSFKPGATRQAACRTSPTASRRSPTTRRQITVKIKPGIKYAPPVNREVTSADIKYAYRARLQRQRAVGLRDLVLRRDRGRARAGRSTGVKPISGITTPDDHDARHQAHASPVAASRGRRRS